VIPTGPKRKKERKTSGFPRRYCNHKLQTPVPAVIWKKASIPFCDKLSSCPHPAPVPFFPEKTKDKKKKRKKE
jgi:hypothetical protein